MKAEVKTYLDAGKPGQLWINEGDIVHDGNTVLDGLVVGQDERIGNGRVAGFNAGRGDRLATAKTVDEPLGLRWRLRGLLGGGGGNDIGVRNDGQDMLLESWVRKQPLQLCDGPIKHLCFNDVD